MCGIAGYSGRFGRELLEKMNDRIAHRGPDDEGLWLDESAGIGLAHRRLSIIDLSALGKQPMWDKTRTVVITYNGELYNYRELRAELEQDGFRFTSHTDTEVVLNMYLRDGLDMLPRLNGIFAFGLFDTRDGSLLLAKDQLGVKPLYWTRTPDGLLFSSELKALLACPEVDRTPDLTAMDQYLTYMWCPAPRTMLMSVKKLEAGKAMVVKSGRIEKHWRYYDLPYDQPIEKMSVSEAVESVRAQLKLSVERQMVADVPVGAFLSGGLDSTSVVAFAKDVNPATMRCFSMDFEGDGVREEGFSEDLPYAQKAADVLGVDLNVVKTGPEMIERLEKMVWHLDEPQADPAPINALLICELARQNGIKVLLSGAGGDDIFTGYRRHFALMQERYWSWLPGSVRRMLKKTSGMLPADSVKARRVAKAFSYADLDRDERIAGYFYWNDPALRRSLFSDPVQSHLAANPEQPLLDSIGHLPENTHDLNRMLYIEARHFLADHNLNYTDKMSMAVGVEVRVPLIDPDLVALAARLPVDMKQRGANGKWIFKKAMEGILPNDIIYRPKTGFLAPVRPWLKNELKPVVQETLSKKALADRGFFDPEAVWKLIEMDRKGRVDGGYTILSLLVIEIWSRLFLDGK